MSHNSQEEEFVRYILGQLVDDISDFEVERIDDELGTLIKVHVPQLEMGKVIGKNGRHVEALKTLLKVVAAKTGARCSIKVIEKE